MKIWNTLVCVCIGVIRGAVLGNANLVLTSSPGTPTDRKLFTLACSISSGPVVNMAWLLNNITEVITQWSSNCTKQQPHENRNIDHFNVSCNDTDHTIQFTFNSTRDQGGWQCGKLVNDTYIYLRSNILQKGVAGSVISSEFPSTMTLYTWSTSGPWSMASQTSEPGTATLSKVSTNDSDSDTVYMVVGAVGGAGLLVVVVVGVVCIRRRRQATDQKEDMKGKNADSSPDYQNTTTCHTVENELYRPSCDMTPVDEAEHEKDDFIMSDAYASVDIPATSTCTPREQGASYDVDADSLYAKPDKCRSLNVPQDLCAEGMKPKNKRQDGQNMSEYVNTGDVYTKPNKR
ncbi:uncharacterized protein [Haliotis asinina]|uniref:uncharacterized protein isoform X1 n=1 Tax=Haliotis asinina TaxID=109174 RepID=UPI0035322798